MDVAEVHKVERLRPTLFAGPRLEQLQRRAIESACDRRWCPGVAGTRRDSEKLENCCKEAELDSASVEAKRENNIIKTVY